MSAVFTLREWFHQKRGRAAEMSRALDINYSFLLQIASGKKRAPLATALEISAYTNNEVSVDAINAVYQAAQQKQV